MTRKLSTITTAKVANISKKAKGKVGKSGTAKEKARENEFHHHF